MDVQVNLKLIQITFLFAISQKLRKYETKIKQQIQKIQKFISIKTLELSPS